MIARVCVACFLFFLTAHTCPQIRLHKDELREEVYLIQIQNSWNKANKILSSWEKDGSVPPLPAHH